MLKKIGLRQDKRSIGVYTLALVVFAKIIFPDMGMEEIRAAVNTLMDNGLDLSKIIDSGALIYILNALRGKADEDTNPKA